MAYYAVALGAMREEADEQVHIGLQAVVVHPDVATTESAEACAIEAGERFSLPVVQGWYNHYAHAVEIEPAIVAMTAAEVDAHPYELRAVRLLENDPPVGYTLLI